MKRITEIVEKVSTELAAVDSNINKEFLARNISIELANVDTINDEILLDVLIKVFSSNITESTLNYDKVAARLLLYKINEVVRRKEGSLSLFDKIKRRVKLNIYDNVVVEKYSRNEVDFIESKVLKYDRDNLLSYAGVRQFYDKYLLKNKVTGENYETIQECNILICMVIFANVSSSGVGKKEVANESTDSSCRVKKTEEGGYECQKAADEDNGKGDECLDISNNERLSLIEKLYNYLSLLKISLPTPIYSGVRSTLKNFSSCCVIDCGDNVDSILESNLILAKAITERYGIGLNLNRIRGIGSPVANGSIIHSGVIPLLKMIESSTKAFMQNGIRNGSCTVSVTFWNWEILTVLDLKNNKGIAENRVRNLDYSIGINKLFLERVLAGDDVTLFSADDVPQLNSSYKLTHEEFKAIYLQYENDDRIKRKKKVSSLYIIKKLVKERYETGRIYVYFIDNINNYSCFKESIFASNLCQEITIPTKPVNSKYFGNRNTTSCSSTDSSSSCIKTTAAATSIRELPTGDTRKEDSSSCCINNSTTYSHKNTATSSNDENSNSCCYSGEFTTFSHENTATSGGDENGLIAVCILSCINVGRLSDIDNFADLEDIYYIVVYFLNCLIDYQQYTFQQMAECALKYRPLGVGISDLFHLLAKKKLKYNTKECFNYIHKLGEKFQYCLIKASCELAKRYGKCEYFYRSSYSDCNYLPTTNYKKTVDTLVDEPLHCNWVYLRQQIDKYGLRNCSLSAIPPTATSCSISNSTPGIDPPRKLITTKISKSGPFFQCVPQLLELREYYTLQSDIITRDYLKFISILQKFVDQSISTNTFYMGSNSSSISYGDIIGELYTAYNYGIKTLYYLNSNKGVDEDISSLQLDVSNFASNVDISNNENTTDCTSGACSI